jgi:predicted lysophospholipase L1 biosynthesis ABC-type transport system permease subunit
VALLRGNGSSLATLTPGLALALVPTLLQVLVDPLGTRALLLGLGCLVLVAVGLASGWAAPLLAGAAVGALLVLRQGTLAQVIPQWVLIGLVGVALTVVGVTWEQRLQEFRKVSAYVRGLR